jgi:hypothetical protein
MTECRVCGEGIWTEQLDFIDGIPLYYVSCSYCKGDYSVQKHIDLNRAAKLEYQKSSKTEQQNRAVKS